MKTPRERLGSLAVSLLALCAWTAAYGQITPSGDAYTNTATPTTNLGAKPVLDVESASQTTYIQFDLSSIPAGYTSASIAKATLKLYVNTVTTAGSFNVDFVNGTWSEKTITADLAPALGTTIVSSVPLTSANVHDFILIDVTPALGAWLDGTEPNDGIALVANSPLNASFDSKENTTNSQTAELDIVFAGGGTLTGVTTASGSGLTGGGTSGTLNLGLTKSCAANQVLQWNGTSWACSSAGSGTVTSVNTPSGSGLTGGPITSSGTLSIAPAGVTNAMLANPSLTVSAGTGLTGGGPVALGGKTTLSLDTSKVPELNTANSFTGNQNVNGNLAVVNNASFKPFSVQSSSTFGTWMNLVNTSPGGHTWNIISAGGTNSEGAGNFAISDLTGLSTIWLEGNVNAGSLVTGATAINSMGCGGPFGGVGFGAKGSTGCANYSLLGEGIHTYLNRPTGGQILFRENNATEMVLASGGNLGIGDTAPVGKLSVLGSESTGNGFGAAMKLSNSAPGGANWYLRAGATGTNTPAGGLSIANDGLYAMAIAPNGNVGIGTTTPTNTLDIRGGLTINSDTPMTSNPHMSFSTMFIGSLCEGNPACGFGTGSPWGAFVPDHNIMITRITITLNSPIDPSCLPASVYVYDAPGGLSTGNHTVLGSVTIPGNAYFVDSGALSINAPAGIPLVVFPTVASPNCNVGASAGGDVYMNTQYVMR
jgi:hypothetical protein